MISAAWMLRLGYYNPPLSDKIHHVASISPGSPGRSCAILLCSCRNRNGPSRTHKRPKGGIFWCYESISRWRRRWTMRTNSAAQYLLDFKVSDLSPPTDLAGQRVS